MATLFVLPIIAHACQSCEKSANTEGSLLSLESFAKCWRLPKVQYLFYHYFYKAIIGDTRWKSRMTKNKRLGTIIAEAYAHTTLRNHYFAWLFEYKGNHPESNLVTEYDNLMQGPLDNSEDQQGMPPTTLFCGDLDMVEVSVTREDFKMHLQGGGKMMDEEHKAAKEHAKSVTNNIRHCMMKTGWAVVMDP